jgi:hypothetical protein
MLIELSAPSMDAALFAVDIAATRNWCQLFLNDRNRVALREGAEDSAVAGMRGLRKDFPTIAQHLGDVVVHLRKIQQPVFVVSTNRTIRQSKKTALE